MALAKRDDEKYGQEDQAYFSYYAMLTHQAQMLQDGVRTTAYQTAILSHPDAFADKIVMDVGAGNGILSMFSLQAGARAAFAVEASAMAHCLRNMVQSSKGGPQAPNSWANGRLAVVHSLMEQVTDDTLHEAAKADGVSLPTGEVKVDTLVSECLGVLLVHERMCETFLAARDRFLRPGGSMFPHAGTLVFGLLQDPKLWGEVRARGEWWNAENFYGVNLTPFKEMAYKEAFASPVVGCFTPSSVIGSTVTPTGSYTCDDHALCTYQVDFERITMDELRDFVVPVSWDVDQAVVAHGLGAWFDLSFGKVGDASFGMTTSPFAPATHWAQVRLLFDEPLALNRGQRVVGTLHFAVNDHRSYDIDADIRVPFGDNTVARRTAHWKLDRQTYSWDAM
ncbi:type I protein arginine methyltransferase [Malassezia cuniculi]|uniref:type I protein arginine methyltransferase n=1 Tax=Malassezia cuniculi TaxID=948313 RepID=A0AAF0EUY3_9BASI|nr:type I protein arginine methyltransferase [Malassezia cuniculi]